VGALLAAVILASGPPLSLSSPGAEASGEAPQETRDEAKGRKVEPAPLDFDLLPPEPTPGAAVDERFEREVRRRRRMLTLHQGLGIATWSALAATAVVGQLDFDDRFRGGGDTGRYRGAHRLLAVGTSALFLGTGLLGLLAPEPYAKKVRLDTATLHKASMGLAAAGMATELVLGLLARRSGGTLRERDLAAAHQVTGYATLGAMTAGAVVLLF